MKIDEQQSDNTNISLINNKTTEKEHHSSSARKNNKSNNVIFAGDLNLNEDTVYNRKQQANRQALRSLIKPYNNDRNIDEHVTSLIDKQSTLLSEGKSASEQIQRLEEQKKGLQSTFGVQADSEEQKNLDILEKSIFHPEKLTDDEYEQLKNMGSLTDYQKEALKFDAMQKLWQEKVDDAAKDYSDIFYTLNGIALERLKTHPMVDAQKEAEKIIESAIKEAIGTLVQEGKENVDEKIDENKEKAEKEQDKKAAADDNTDKAGLSEAEQTNQIKLADEIKSFVQKQNMLEEDLKGIVVDEVV